MDKPVTMRVGSLVALLCKPKSFQGLDIYANEEKVRLCLMSLEESKSES